MARMDELGGNPFQGQGRFTRLGRVVAGYYAAIFVVGLVVGSWFPPPWNSTLTLGMLMPFASSLFGWWQPFTQLLVTYADASQVFNFALSMLAFWLMAWRMEQELGRARFLLILFGVPFVTGILALPLTLLPIFQAPFTGFSVMLNCLIIAAYMLNKEGVGNYMFVIPIKMVYLIYLMIGMQALYFIAQANPLFAHQLISAGLTWAIFRYDIHVDPELWRLRRQHRTLLKQQRRFEVIPGGRKDDGPIYH